MTIKTEIKYREAYTKWLEAHDTDIDRFELSDQEWGFSCFMGGVESLQAERDAAYQLIEAMRIHVDPNSSQHARFLERLMNKYETARAARLSIPETGVY